MSVLAWTLAGCGSPRDPADSASGGSSAGSGTGGSFSLGGNGGNGGNGGSGGSPSAGQGGGSASVEVQLLALNDFHGHLEPPTGNNGEVEGTLAGGVAHLAHHVQRLRSEQPNTVVVSAGDLIGASPLSSALFHDEPTIDAMDLLGLDLNAVGNHEFDEGWQELLRLQDGGCHPIDGCQGRPSFDGASFDFLAANVTVDSSGETLFDGVAIRTFDGIDIAFIGMTLEGTPNIVSASATEGVSFADEVETVSALVPELQARGIEAIVVLLHEGGVQFGGYDDCVGISGAVVSIAEGLPEAVDVVVTGHTHRAYNCTIADKLVTSAGSYGRFLTDIDMTLDRDTRDVSAKAASNVIATRDGSVAALDELVGEVAQMAAPLAERQVGTITDDLTRTVSWGGQSTLGAVIADSQLFATQAPEDGGAQVAFMNAGGIRADLEHAAAANESSDGIVTYEEAFAVQPFSNTLVVMTLTGAQLFDLLEQQFEGTLPLQVSSSLFYRYSKSAPLGAKVDRSSVELDGQPVAEGDSIRVCVNSFMADGGGSYVALAEGTDRTLGPGDLEALQAYFQTSSPLSPPALDRVWEDD